MTDLEHGKSAPARVNPAALAVALIREADDSRGEGTPIAEPAGSLEVAVAPRPSLPGPRFQFPGYDHVPRVSDAIPCHFEERPPRPTSRPVARRIGMQVNAGRRRESSAAALHFSWGFREVAMRERVSERPVVITGRPRGLGSR